MKKMRKLLPAIAMLLVSAVMMSTASFAWFTMNSEVKATGMEVTAIAPDSIWISQAADSGWASTVALNGTGPSTGKYTPAMTVKFAGDPSAPDYDSTKVTGREVWDAWTFAELTGAASQRVKNDGTIENLASADLTTSTSFYKDDFYLKLDAKNGNDAEVYVNVGVSHALGSDPAADEIYKALRVAVATGEAGAVGTAVVFAPTAISTDGTSIVLAPLDTGVTSNTLVTLEAGAAATKVVVYAWIEGTDTDCMNDNALNEDLFEITLYFSIDAEDKLPATP